MVQMFDLPAKGGVASALGSALGQGLSQGSAYGLQKNFEQMHESQRAAAETSALQQAIAGVPDNDYSALQRAILTAPGVGNEFKKLALSHLHSQEVASESKRYHNELISLGKEKNEIAAAKPKNPPGGLTGQPVPVEIGSKIKEIIQNNPKASSDELGILFDENAIPRTFSNSYVENRRRQDETNAKNIEANANQRKTETTDLRKDIANKAIQATQSIENKKQQEEIINNNELTNPTVATLLEALPFKLGKRFLSEDAIQYKAGLIDDFADMKNTFNGPARVKEIDLWEDKIADLYLTDEQKKRVIKARMNSLNADIIRGEEAAKLEEDQPNLSILQFSKKLNEKLKERLKGTEDQLFDSINGVLDDAERMKKRTLDLNNPQDAEVGRQILKEAGGDIKKAYKLAERKGYKLPKK